MRSRQQATLVPKNIWDLMSPEDQRLYRRGHVTEEDVEKWHQGREKEMHEQFASWLNRSGYWKKYIHARMDKKTGIGKGVFDFTIWDAGKIAFVEFKTEHGRLRPEQRDFLSAQIANRTPAIVARSYEDAVGFIKNVFASVV